MNERELKQELKAWAYAMGYAVLGDNCGGIITTLLQRKGLMATRKHLSAAAKAGDPKAYVGGILRQASDEINNACKIGDRMGNYEWDGSKWKEFEESRVRRNDEVAAKHGYQRNGENYVKTAET